MKLSSRDGASVELTVEGYQFSDLDMHELDLNWVMIRGVVTTSDDRGWEFTDPCMTTHQLIALADLLDQAADSATLACMEPNLAFRLTTRDGQSVLEVTFRAESVPPWAGRKPVVVPLQMTREQVRAASEEWCREIASYPVR